MEKKLDDQLRDLLRAQDITSLDPGPSPEPGKVALGQALFFDKELSGNRDISCATCHHPTLAGGDGISLSVGTGGFGLGTERRRGTMRGIIPRNAPEIFNRGAPEWHTMFWDSRVSTTLHGGFTMPAEIDSAIYPAGLDNVVAAQAMFPVTSRGEMRGDLRDVDVHGNINELAVPRDDDPHETWQTLMTRLMAIDEYRSLFADAYPQLAPEDLGFQHAANAIAAFEIGAFTLLDAPWDRYLGGDDTALSEDARQGAILFYGKARCSECHSGNLMTDQKHHNVGIPQIGPGKGRENRYVDMGRARETDDPSDEFAFRTPPLRNVAITGPWMHNGAYTSLESTVRHMLDAREMLETYDPSQLSIDVLSETELKEEIVQRISASLDPIIKKTVQLSDEEIAKLTAFLQSLTDPAAVDLSHLVPESVPSGLPVADGPTAPTMFRRITEEAGIRMPHRPGYQITGQAWGDVNNDGWLDLYLTTGEGANQLYRNNGDGSFSLSPLNSQVALSEHDSGGALFADYDNDGWSDLYVLGRGPNILFHNEEGLGFTDVTADAGVGGDKTSKSATWGDFDSDGNLDLYVVNWSCIPRCAHPLEGEPDSLYHNNGNGTFTDITDALRIRRRGAGFVATWTDYDNDGDLDLYVVNDEFAAPVGNQMWRNDGPGCAPLAWCFSEVSEQAGSDARVMGMGLTADDFDGDGHIDYFVSNAGQMVLLRNRGDGTFENVAEQTGVALEPSAIGWGALSFDCDNDGFRDIYLATMARRARVSPFNPLFHNQGDGTFVEMGHSSGADDPGPSVGLAAADYDGDGWVDLVVGNYNRGYELFHNESATDSLNHWLALKLVGDGPVNRDAVGTRVLLTTDDGRQQTQEVRSGIGLGGGSTLTLHFGLGQAGLDQVAILWPDGTHQVLVELAPDRAYEVRYGNLARPLEQHQVE
ncbi:MAG: FG-GAP-like repeat-containing protein [Chloroflexota bacterium]|nr:FG-GAP-like repeat-containing protein [Chloroflexota bacterium]